MNSSILTQACTFVVVASSLVGSTTYTLTEISAGLGFSVNVFGLNNRGQVVGNAPTSSGDDRAFLWDQGQVTIFGTLGGNSSTARSINQSGQIAGFSRTSGAGWERAVVWQSGQITNLGTLGGAGLWSIANGINDSGYVTGYSTDQASPRAFVWNGTTMRDLGTLGGNFSYGAAINNSGQVTGRSDDGTGRQRAFIWSGDQMRSLGDLGGGFSEGVAINALGQVAGNSEDNLGRQRAFFWNGTTMRDIGTLGGSFSHAYGLNSLGHVVGSSWSSLGGVGAFIWDGTSMNDLNSKVQNLGGWQLTRATAINERGEIIGDGIVGGEMRAFLLTPNAPPLPVPEPATFTLCAPIMLGLLCLCIGRRWDRYKQ